MSDRIPLDHLTSDALDALYEQIEAAEATESQRQLATARAALASATTRAARAETALTRVRALHQPQPDGTGFPDGKQCGTCSQDGGDGYQYLVPYPCPTIQALDQPAPAATEATEPREHCGDLKPQFSENTARTECVLRPGHTGSHADHNNTRWWWTDEAVAPPEEAPGA